MSEAPEPSPEVGQEARFKYRVHDGTARLIRNESARLGVTTDQFILDAVDFRILQLATREEHGIVELVRKHGIDRAPFASMHTSFTERLMPDEGEAEEIFPMRISEEQMQVIMLGAAYKYEADIDVRSDMTEWDQQRFKIGGFLREAVTNYAARIAAEYEGGWQVNINLNTGGDTMMLDPVIPNAGEA